ncbi:hypothetical protein CDD82_4364 [Ophiocordyceps australis]|uniref:Reverse transcriptase Ty1/copia-type domain-containing protein n=1 Tax=Ophiocordyceps australis TaxID=1399860 RepID=A0A2C5Z7E1_9HYPO|nr:hypothetical protein CDD82_4364 [Ophiocordyceps australis]
MTQYKVKFLGDLKWFIGINVLRDRPNRQLWLSQESYVDKIAGKYGLLEAITAPKVPLGIDPLKPNITTAEPKDIKLYQSLVGSLLYAAIITRPDIAYAASKLSQFLQNPSQYHIKCSKGVISYLNASKRLGIRFCGNTHEATYMTDASFGDNYDRKSSHGFVISLHTNTIQMATLRNIRHESLWATSAAAYDAPFGPGRL